MNLAFLPIPKEQVSMTREVGSARDTPERIEIGTLPREDEEDEEEAWPSRRNETRLE